MRIGYYSDTYVRTDDGWRLRTRSMTFLRKSGAQDSGRAARPDPARPHRPLMELDEYRASLDAWLEQNLSALQPDHAGPGSLDDQMEQLAKVKRLTFEAGWMRWGWPERVGGLGGSILLRALPRRSVDHAGPGRTGPLLHDRGAGPDHDRLRHPGAGRRDGAPTAQRCGDLVPGVFRAGDRQQPGRADLPGHPGRRRVARRRARRSGPAWPSTPSAVSS